MTIFLTTQYMEEADQLCERLAIIDHGRIVTEGSPASLKSAIGADVITIRLSRDESSESNRDRALGAVRQMSGVTKATIFDEDVSVHAKNGGAALLGILRALDGERIPVREVALAHPSLDEVFLQHTGHQMRPEEVKPGNRTPWAGHRRR
jgi:ABC-2 type transport system ATP-binding protein